MPRIVKAAPARRAEILSHAMTLFFRKGYEATTMNDILESVALSKGAFYHHFASKEELLEAFTASLTASIAEQAAPLLKETCSERERLNMLLAICSRVQHEPEPAPVAIYATLFRSENALLYQRLMTVGVRGLAPVLEAIVAAGVAKGEFDVPDVRLVVEMVLQLSISRFHVIVEAVRIARAGDMSGAERVLRERFVAERKYLERLLGLPAGGVVLADPGHPRKALAALTGTARAKSRRRRAERAAS
jgi:AcrR family transcriptional regulator